jgi:hypothetical protein
MLIRNMKLEGGGKVVPYILCIHIQKNVQFLMVSLEVFIDINPSGHTMALGWTQPPTEISTRNISWGVKAAGGQS